MRFPVPIKVVLPAKDLFVVTAWLLAEPRRGWPVLVFRSAVPVEVALGAEVAAARGAYEAAGVSVAVFPG